MTLKAEPIKSIGANLTVPDIAEPEATALVALGMTAINAGTKHCTESIDTISAGTSTKSLNLHAKFVALGRLVSSPEMVSVILKPPSSTPPSG